VVVVVMVVVVTGKCGKTENEGPKLRLLTLKSKYDYNKGNNYQPD
jgi:hypothetical protein